MTVTDERISKLVADLQYPGFNFAPDGVILLDLSKEPGAEIVREFIKELEGA